MCFLQQDTGHGTDYASLPQCGLGRAILNIVLPSRWIALSIPGSLSEIVFVAVDSLELDLADCFSGTWYPRVINEYLDCSVYHEQLINSSVPVVEY